MGIIEFVFLIVSWVFSTIVLVLLWRERKSRQIVAQRELQATESIKERDKAFKATSVLNSIVLETLDFERASQLIANAIPQFLGYETGVLALIDEPKGMLKRVAISETTGGRAALESLEIPFESIDIGLTEVENYCIRALRQHKPLYTTSLYDVLRPVVTKENSDKVQKMMGTVTTLIFPIYSEVDKPLGTFIVSLDKEYELITEYEHQTIRNFVDGIRIALRNAALFTSLEKTKEKLETANVTLKQLDRLKDDFVSVASHELRTPMTAIKSYVWMILNNQVGQVEPKQREYLQRTYSSTNRLINLVNEMLNISRIESGRMDVIIAKTDPVKLVEEVFTEVEPRARELGITLAIERRALPEVMADADKIKEVLINLIGNSLKFTPRGGTITVNFDVSETMVTTRVNDDGAGIDLGEQESLFQKFGFVGTSYKVNKTDAKGSGLGLYISKSIIDMHKGAMTAFSEGTGKGATFSFSLKIYNESDFALFQQELSTHEKSGLGVIHSSV